MQTASASVPTVRIAWTLFRLVPMAAQARLVLDKTMAAKEIRTDNSNLSRFKQRLARAHANCVERFPIFGRPLLAALLAN